MEEPEDYQKSTTWSIENGVIGVPFSVQSRSIAVVRLEMRVMTESGFPYHRPGRTRAKIALFAVETSFGPFQKLRATKHSEAHRA